MKSILSLTALQLLVSSAAALPAPQSRPLSDRDFPWHITVPKNSGITKRQSSLPTTWDPPSDLVTPLEEVWNHEQETYSDPLGFKNYGFDQVIAAGGKINYCIRWESSQTITAAQREQIAAAASRSYNKWIAGLAGFDGWPYDTVEVNVVGYAVSDTSLLEGDTTGLDIYTTTDADGIPECDPTCGRFFHQDGDYSGCAAGADRHYDESLWLTDGFSGGAGGDWGQRVGTEYFLENIESDNIHIYLHEIGHTFALDDFYDWTPTGVTNFIMLAGSATEITEFDYWMLRDWWRNLKDRYDLSDTSSSTSPSSSSSSSSSAAASTLVPAPSTTSASLTLPTISSPAIPTQVAAVPETDTSSTIPVAPASTPSTTDGAAAQQPSATTKKPCSGPTSYPSWGNSGWGEHDSQAHPWSNNRA
ncbi:hypothetical protein BJY01DRAFT_175892 [Aspergillus pseudoustus]|uniref:Cellulose-binding domain-containing protein n=1 Tax=Aspergillus pseudoustus TaxID=1810923 RepID=A0ABR4K1I2_9EURO